VPLFEFVSCFKNRAKTLGISLGHTFHPIELKLGVLPILFIENQIKIQKIRIKKLKFWISTSASTPLCAPLKSFAASVALSFSFCICFDFLLHILFLSSYYSLNICSPSNEFLL
jgi:hypothetical protein